MDDQVVIKVENVSKKYCKSLKRSMWYGVKDIWRNIFGRSSHSDKLRKDEFWALKDISFEVKKGEAVGIIGSNGAGKTTLLQLLNGIFWPDKGKITIRGKVRALIAIGAGFHPLLTGRENIYINGTILGMSKKEIDKKFDSIEEFADIGDFLDTPVKYYSSGMYMRLGFAIAIHCEPDILLIDEVLAVGDLKFREKCLRYMKKLKDSETTILFISHNLEFARRLCENIIFINHGQIDFCGSSLLAIESYLRSMKPYKSKSEKQKSETSFDNIKSPVLIKSIKLTDINRREKNEFKTGGYMKVTISYFARETVYYPTFSVAFLERGQLLADNNQRFDNYQIESISGAGEIVLLFERLFLLHGYYEIRAYIADEDSLGIYDQKATSFFVREGLRGFGLFYHPHRWIMRKN